MSVFFCFFLFPSSLAPTSKTIVGKTLSVHSATTRASARRARRPRRFSSSSFKAHVSPPFGHDATTVIIVILERAVLTASSFSANDSFAPKKNRRVSTHSRCVVVVVVASAGRGMTTTTTMLLFFKGRIGIQKVETFLESKFCQKPKISLISLFPFPFSLFFLSRGDDVPGRRRRRR